MYSYVKFDPPIVAAPYPRDHGLNKFESKLPEDTSKQVTAFLAYWFLLRRFFSMYSYVKNFDPILAPPYPRGS
uniref:Uncharacterized protein n=1 Tax=Magallana gigas TaxID=29159 RepID=K1PFM7_MAGGI